MIVESKMENTVIVNITKAVLLLVDSGVVQLSLLGLACLLSVLHVN